MSVGGADETHCTLPLRPQSGSADHAEAEALPTLRFGRYELRVLRCVGHHARAGEGGVVSDYPLLLLHVQVALRLAPHQAEQQVGGGGGRESPADAARREAQELGDAIERMLLG